MSKKIKLAFVGLLTCCVFAITSNASVTVKNGKVWLAITTVASYQRPNKPGAIAAIGAIGIADAAVWGFAVGSVATPVTGAIVGAAAGL